jgi:hypothetical protein
MCTGSTEKWFLSHSCSCSCCRVMLSCTALEALSHSVAAAPRPHDGGQLLSSCSWWWTSEGPVAQDAQACQAAGFAGMPHAAGANVRMLQCQLAASHCSGRS